jgi:peptide/nickel transport system ATP-binding protein
LLQAVPRITGGGVPDAPEDSEAFLAPLCVHEGFGEPGGAA